MSGFRVFVVGSQVAGKSLVALDVARLVSRSGKLGDPEAVLFEPSMTYKAAGVRTYRCHSGAGFLQRLRQAEGPIIADDCSTLYGHLLRSCQDATAMERERRGLPPRSLGVEEFTLVAERFLSLFRTAGSLGVPTVEVYRRAPHYRADGEGGRVESEGLKTYGWAQGGRGGELILWLKGGIGSAQDPEERSIQVIKDPSLLAPKEARRLPRIESPKDLQKLSRLLAELLTPSIRAGLKWAKEESEAWARGEWPEDSWPEVLDKARRDDAAHLVGQVKALCDIHGITGRLKTVFLFDHFDRVGDLERLADLPAERLAACLPGFEAALRRHADEQARRSRILSAITGRFKADGVAGTSGAAQQHRALRLRKAFGVEEEDALSDLPIETLEDGMLVFQSPEEAAS